jgi:hypothetical protein
MKYAALIVVCCAVGLLAGCGKDESTTGTGGSLTPITVTGKVIGANKQPVPGVPVLIAGIPSVNTDANGNFSIANVGRPYTITVIDAANKQSLLYRGLTRSDPTLIFLGSTPGVKKVASLTGRIFPSSSYPEPATRKTLVGFVSVETGKTTTATAATGLYTLSNAEWYGPSVTTGTLHALQYDFSTTTGLPTTYVGYGVRSGVPLLDATPNPNGNDTMSVVGTTSMTGSVTAPAGYTISAKTVGMVLGNTAGLTLLSDNNPATSFTYAMPNISGATFRIGVVATKASTGSTIIWKANVAGNATGVSVTVPAAPELSLPINAATNVTTSTPFSWAQYTGGVHLVIFSGGGSKPSYYILTSATSDSIPNLSAAGLGLPASSAYSWNVYGFGPYADVDAAAGADGFLGVLSGAVGSDASYGVSATRSFTTAP